MQIPGYAVAGVSLLSLCLAPSTSRGEEAFYVDIKGYLSGYASSGNRKLDDEHSLLGSNAGMQARVRTPEGLSFYADARYFSSDQPENGLREAYLNTDTGSLTVRAGRQIIIWGRADRFNPTDIITPRNYEILSYDDDDQRFGVEGVQTKYHITDSHSFTAVVLPAFRSSVIPSALLPSGIGSSSEPEHYSVANTQAGFKLDRSGDTVDWSVSYFNGFSTLPEIELTSGGGLILENRKLRMIGADFAATAGEWSVRGEAAYVDLAARTDFPAIYPHSYLYAVLGAERNMAQTLILNIQWLHRQVRDFIDPRTVGGPLGEIAMGNALIHNQFDRKQDGVSLSIRDKWLHETLQGEISAVYFFDHGDYLVKPEVRYSLTDQWSVLLFAETYRGPKDSFLGGLRINSLAYAELRYQFGPFLDNGKRTKVFF